ncbi:MAG: alpha/beta fold hydrolase [Jiangellaceae bacterium]
MRGIEALAGSFVELDSGVRLHVRRAPVDEPGRPTAVAVHGLGGSATNWTALSRALGAELDVWAPDLPGFGESAPSGSHTVIAYVADMTALLERFRGPVHLIGNSMGGMISVLVAAARPDLVATLTLISPAMPQYRLPGAARATALVAIPGVGERLLERVGGLPAEEQVRQLAAVIYADPAAIADDELAFAIAERGRRMQQPYADAVLLEALRSIVGQYTLPPSRSAWASARRVLCPMLVLVGGKDTLVGAWSARRWRRTQPGARVVAIPGAGHVAMMEHPAVVAELITTFLRDVSENPTTTPRADVHQVDD